VGQTYYNGANTILGLSGVHVVGANTNYINFGQYITYTNNITKAGGILTATRIA
jgi:predicted amino acid racemase